VVGLMLGGGVLGPSDDLAGTGLFELSLHLGKGAPIGWGGGLSFVGSGEGIFAALMPIGGTLRFGAGALTVASGVSTVPDGFHLAIPVGAWVELPLGPIHVTASGQLDYRLTGDPLRLGPLSSDLGQIGLALRFPGDRRYWPRAFAGAGPYVRGSVLDAGGDAVYQLTAGIALYGAD
jgi:hypothetical protein